MLGRRPADLRRRATRQRGEREVEFVALAPEAEGDAKATLTVSFDERANDGPTADPKQDTVRASENTTVEVLDGTAASFVPKGASLVLTTIPRTQVSQRQPIP